MWCVPERARMWCVPERARDVVCPRAGAERARDVVCPRAGARWAGVGSGSDHVLADHVVESDCVLTGNSGESQSNHQSHPLRIARAAGYDLERQPAILLDKDPQMTLAW